MDQQSPPCERENTQESIRLSILYQTLRAASASLDPREVLSQIVSTLAHLGGYPVASACLVVGERLELVKSVGCEWTPPDRLDGVHGRVVHTGEPQFVRDVRQDADYVAGCAGMNSEICVPVKVDGRVVGTINIESTADRPLTDCCFELMAALSEQAGLVMGNALLHRNLVDSSREHADRQAELLAAVQADREQQQRMLQALLDTTPDIIIFKDRQHRFMACSELLCWIFGQPSEKIVGKTDFDFFGPDAAECYWQEETVVLETGQRFVADHLLDTPLGKRWYEAIKIPLYDGQGHIVGLVSAERDITGRKEAEEALDRRALEMTALYETSLEISVQRDISQLLQTIVRQAADLIACTMGGLYLVRPDGQSLDLAVSHNLPAKYTGNVLQIGEGLSGRVAQTGDPLMVEDHRNWAGAASAYSDGPFARVLAVPLKVGGRIIGVLNVSDPEKIDPFTEDEVRLAGLFADQAAIALENVRLYEAVQRELAERARVEAELDSQRRLLRTVLDSIPDLIVVKDRESVFRMVNQSLCEFLKLPQDQLLGVTDYDVFSPEDAERYRQEEMWVMETGRTLVTDHERLGSQGGHWLRVVKRPLYDHEGQITGVLCSYVDISERVLRERELERRNQQLTILYETMRASTSSLDPGEVARRAVRALSRLGQFTIGAARFKDGDDLPLVETFGYPQPFVDRITPYEGVHGRMLRTGEPQFVRDVREDPDYVPVSDDISSEICVPIKSQDEIVGSLIVESTADRPLTDDDLQLVLTLSDQLSLVLHNALLYSNLEAERNRVQAFNEQLLALQRVATVVISRRDLKDVLDFVCRSAADLVGADSAAIMLFDEEGLLSVRGAYGFRSEATLRIRLRSGESLAGRVAELGQPLISNDAPNDPRITIPVVAAEGYLSIVIVPLIVGERVIGTLNVHSALRRDAFGQNQVQVLSLLANPVAVAIENARLHAATVESEVRYRSMFEGTLDGLVIADGEDGRILDANPAYQKMLGYSLAELCERRVWELRDPEDQPAARRLWDEQIRGVTRFGRTVPYRSKDGRRVEAEFAGQLIEMGGRRVWVASLRDVTEKLQLEEDLRQAQKMEAIGTMAGGVAHDFNNILGAILGYASFIRTSLPPDDPLRADAEVIEKAARRGADLTRQLLAFARGGHYEMRPFSANPVIKGVLQLLERTVDKSISITPVLEKNLSLVEGDLGQIEQLVLNLCLNGCEAMPYGGFLTISTNNVHLDSATSRREIGREAGDYILLTVSDTGHGIDAAGMEHLFVPFFSTKKDRPGKRHSGLGLAVVFGVVNAHRGGIKVSSEVGQGTTFRVWLPAAPRSAAATEETPVEPAEEQGSGTVLVVDDEEPIRQMLERMLTRAGYRVLLAASGPEAMEALRAYHGEIDAVILDMIMPVMSGYTTYLHIRSLDPDLPVLLASGYSEEGLASQAIKAGAKGFIPKPFPLQEMLSKLRSILEASP